MKRKLILPLALLLVTICSAILIPSTSTGPDYILPTPEPVITVSPTSVPIVDSSIAESLEEVKILYYVDGDTVWVMDSDGNKQKVRFIGTTCEESASLDESKNTEGGRLASEFIKTVISEGQTVFLQKDVSETDVYDRLLRYIWLEVPTSLTDITEVKTKMLNAVMISEGYATVGYYKPDVSYYTTFKALLEEAKEDKRGLWEEYWN